MTQDSTTNWFSSSRVSSTKRCSWNQTSRTNLKHPSF